MIIEVKSDEMMKRWGEQFGLLLRGGEVIELVGDVGAGKTTLTKGLAVGMGIDETIQSPTFTINRVYDAPASRRLVHYDFYRLNDAGIMANELDEAIREPGTVTVIEWADVVGDVLPTDRLSIKISSPTELTRSLHITAGGLASTALMEQLA